VSRGFAETKTVLISEARHNTIAGRQSTFLSEGTGGKWQAAIGCSQWKSGAEPLEIFTSTPLDYKKIPFSVSKYI